MVLKKSELRHMIREVLREELSLNEAKGESEQEKAYKAARFKDWLGGRKMIDEDGVMSSLGREVSDCLSGVSCPGPNGKSQFTYEGKDFGSERTTMNNGLISVYTYTLAHDIPEDFIANGDLDIYSKLDQGFKKLQRYETSHPDCLELKHELKCVPDRGNTYKLVYVLTIVPNKKCVMWSNSYPDPRRGQTPEDVRAWGVKVPDLKN